MKNRHRSARYLSYVIIMLFISATVLPSCIAQIHTSKINIEKSPQDFFVKKASHANEDDENFFSFAIVWGPFEVRGTTIPFLALDVHNRASWYNRTINVLGYQNWENKWVFKKAYWVTDNFFHIGFVGRHWLFALCFIDVDAF